MDGWYRLSSPNATFAVKVEEDRIVFTAPYGRQWLLGKPVSALFPTLERKGWEITSLGP